MKNKYLYLNTAGPYAKLAIIREGKAAEYSWEAGRELSATLSQKVAEFMAAEGVKKEELAGLVVFPGPGSFTGLRIGIAFANAFAFGLSVPIFTGNEKYEFNLEEPQKQIIPVYGAEPNITKPRESK